MEPIDRASERQLRDYDQAKVIAATKIVKTEDGYVVVIQVSWKPGDIVVYNQRNRPRAWQSLDRLLAYLGDIAPSVRTMTITLNDLPEKPERVKARSSSATAARKAPARKMAKKATASRAR